MTDILNILQGNGYTFVAMNNGEIRFSFERGVAPIIELIDKEPQFLNGAVVADKVIGKAAAMLLCAYGVKSIRTPLTSRHALNYIKSKDTRLEYDEAVDYIINRDRTDMCPMEKNVLDTNDEKEAERLIRNKIKELRRA